VVIEAVTRYDPEQHEQVPTGDVRVAAYLPQDEAIERTRLQLEEAFGICSKFRVSRTAIQVY